MKSKLTGVILAGGKSKRLGRDKALETFNGEPLILKVISSIETLVDEIIVVVNDDKRKNDFSFMKNMTQLKIILKRLMKIMLQKMKI